MNSIHAAATDAPAAIVFERLLPKYERIFGAPPPVHSARVDEINRLMREALASATVSSGDELLGRRPV